ncbi:hypothetical protein [Nesterenkonia pannonica]|uniref:hypothetical protein n=1 Tax=Nesterenkonia pannonica TaxID=1548602 RepID=UPI00216406D0|nr:hypothetical protein [Nesterenkonia pannonica]
MAEQGPEGLGTEAERSFAGPEDLRVTARYQSYEAFQGFGDVWEQQSAVCLPVLAEIDGGAAETRIFDEGGVQGHITVFEYPEHSGVSVNLYQVMGSSSVQYWAQSSDPQDEELIVDMVVELIEHSEASIRAMGR